MERDPHSAVERSPPAPVSLSRSPKQPGVSAAARSVPPPALHLGAECRRGSKGWLSHSAVSIPFSLAQDWDGERGICPCSSWGEFLVILRVRREKRDILFSLPLILRTGPRSLGMRG